MICINPFKKIKAYDFHQRSSNENDINVNMNNESKIACNLWELGKCALQNLKSSRKNQAVVITGESGSGKTESTKILLDFLSENDSSGGRNLKDQVIGNNFILEAFGNAKTMRNDNSSRFGKFIRVGMDENSKIIHASISNYLLEKSRVTKHAL